MPVGSTWFGDEEIGALGVSLHGIESNLAEFSGGPTSEDFVDVHDPQRFAVAADQVGGMLVVG